MVSFGSEEPLEQRIIEIRPEILESNRHCEINYLCPACRERDTMPLQWCEVCGGKGTVPQK